MATDPYFLERLRSILNTKKINWTEKRMFGGECFMVNDKMCFGTFKDGLMARVDPEEIGSMLARGGASLMTMGGKPMKGYLIIEEDGFDRDSDLEFWVQKCLEFNPKAKSSKKKK
jgi:TfoX/Sxy family transcriptional regulator of competence genes